MNISHRFQTDEKQKKFHAGCQLKFWLSRGLAPTGPLNERPVAYEVVWAETAEQAHEILMNSGNDFESVTIYDRADVNTRVRLFPNPTVVEPWNLPEDHEDYCPF